MERLNIIKKGIQKAVKKPHVILIILAIVTLLIIFTKVLNNQAGKGSSVHEDTEQNRTEVTENRESAESGENQAGAAIAENEENQASGEIEESETIAEGEAGAGIEEIDTIAEGDAGAESSLTPEDVISEDSDFKTMTFDLEHAINVGESIHLSENGNLEWQGKIVHHKGGTLGAYEEVVNIFNGTDYHIYEIYDVLVSAHPELKTDHLEPYECEDINDYYGFTVSRAPAEINEIDNALREGKLVQLQVHSNMWRDAEGEQVDWPGYHSGLIFYFDGSLYHMKASGKINQMNAVYTREQLIDWIGGTSKQLVIYTKNQPE